MRKEKNISLISNVLVRHRRQWHPTLVLLPGKPHGWRSLVGCGPWGHWVGHDWATSLSLSRIGEGNGSPLQCSCLENPRDGEPGGLPSMGSHRFGHDWSDLAVAAARHWRPWDHSQACRESPVSEKGLTHLIDWTKWHKHSVLDC